MRKALSILVLTAALFAGPAAAAGPTLTALPAPLALRNPAMSWAVTGPDSLTIDAGAKTNWFVTPKNDYSVDNAPTLLFAPAETFALTAKVSLTPKVIWDSGALAVYVDKDHWAKLCLEASGNGDGRLQVVMVVTNGVSDDAYSIPAAGDSLYLRVTRQGPVVIFFSSEDGQDWKMVRQFRLATDKDLRAGFLAQSPVGDGMHVTFSDIRYKPDIKNIYHAE